MFRKDVWICTAKREAMRCMSEFFFFSLAKSADKPSAAGLALHAVRLIPRVVFALITDCFMTFSEPNT